MTLTIIYLDLNCMGIVVVCNKIYIIENCCQSIVSR